METLLDRLVRREMNWGDSYGLVAELPDDEEYYCPICGSCNRRIHDDDCGEDRWTS